jgi:hypothetical protein
LRWWSCTSPSLLLARDKCEIHLPGCIRSPTLNKSKEGQVKVVFQEHKSVVRLKLIVMQISMSNARGQKWETIWWASEKCLTLCLFCYVRSKSQIQQCSVLLVSSSVVTCVMEQIRVYKSFLANFVELLHHSHLVTVLGYTTGTACILQNFWQQFLTPNPETGSLL